MMALQLLSAIGLFLCGASCGYLWRRRKPAIRVTYAGGQPFRSMTFDSPNGDGAVFAQSLARLLVRDDMVAFTRADYDIERFSTHPERP